MTPLPAPESGGAKAPLSLLFPAVILAGFGLGTLALTASLPPVQAPPLPAPQPATQPALGNDPAATGPASAGARPWPALFGAPAAHAPTPVASPPVAVLAPVIQSPATVLTDYILRGLVVQGDGGWAMIEADGGIGVFRPGDILPGGEELLAIHTDSVEIGLDGARQTIAFDDQPRAAPATTPTADMATSYQAPPPLIGN